MAQQYTVQEGDTLFKLAERFYGDGNRWEEIARANGNLDPRTLQIGQILQIPGIGASGAPVSPSTTNSSMAQEILNAHNQYRAQVGVPPLTWSNTLARQAQEWADYLSSRGTLEHSENRGGTGENLWRGTSGRFSFTQMVDSWGEERQHFVRGTFPDVSSTGNWADVGHYTQMVWRDTTEVGGAGADGRDGNYRLVCRYAPSGNVRGRSVF